MSAIVKEWNERKPKSKPRKKNANCIINNLNQNTLNV